MNPDELISMKEEILKRVQRRAETYEQVSQNCSKSATLAVIEEFGLGDISIVKALFVIRVLRNAVCLRVSGLGLRHK